MHQSLPNRLKTLAAPIMARFRKNASFGVRAIALNEEGRIFLIRHTYTQGWHLPGGGVDAGETAEEATRRELVEEGNISLGAPLNLIGVYLNRLGDQRGHVILYSSENCRQTAPKQPDYEIAESGFFSPSALPQDLTRATRGRLEEFFEKRPISPYW